MGLERVASACSERRGLSPPARQRGAIVNAASVAALVAWPEDAVYNATKAGVLLLTKAGPGQMSYGRSGLKSATAGNRASRLCRVGLGWNSQAACRRACRRGTRACSASSPQR